MRVAVVGVGAFGENHLRVLNDLPGVEIAAVVDPQQDRAAAAAQKYNCTINNLQDLDVDAAIVAVPTVKHADVACALLERGIDVLIEKPIAPDLESAQRIENTSKGRIVQIGHLERFNPAILALQKEVTTPLFFEIHRMSTFSPRSLDVDVVLDLMVHDIDIVLTLVGSMPEEIRAAGISILSEKVDIANVRLAFPGGCVANLTASRISTEKIRKLRLFQPHQYISVDYQRQDGAVFTVSGNQQIGFDTLQVQKDEPLRLELQSFLESVRTRRPPQVTVNEGVRALEVALDILGHIEKHSRVVAAAIG